MRHSLLLLSLCSCFTALLGACLVEEIDLCNQPDYPWECTCPDAQAELKKFDYWDPRCEVCKSNPDDAMCKERPPADAGKDAAVKGDAGDPEDSGVVDAGLDAAGADGGRWLCPEQCEGSLPHCDVDAQSCEACTAHSHCTVDEPAYCVEHKCVECRAGVAEDCATNVTGLVCVEGSCVQCASHADCTAADKARCNADNVCVPCDDDAQCTGRVDAEDDALAQCVAGACVECENHADCTDPAKAMCNANHECVPCDDDMQCDGRQDGDGDPIEVCDAGECVECTGLKYDACLSGATQYVCDSLQRTCSDKVKETAFACQSCVSDAQCVAGHLCMHTKFGLTDTGAFCLWRQDATGVGAPNGDCTGVRQYRAAETAWTSLDVVGAVTVCRSSVTTCQGQNDFQIKTCDDKTATGDAQCGAPNADDAYCAPFGAGHRCTVPCIAFDDCEDTRPGDDLECQVQSLSTGNVKACVFN